jgi:hypothetical protein
MKLHWISIAFILAAGACIVLFGLGLVGAVFVALAVVCEWASWVFAWRGARRRRAQLS